MSKTTAASPSPRFVIRKAVISNEYMRLEYKDALKLNWTTEPKLASPYLSKYAAKNHLKILQGILEIPETIVIEPVIIS